MFKVCVIGEHILMEMTDTHLNVYFPPVMGQQGFEEHLIHNFGILPMCATASWSDKILGLQETCIISIVTGRRGVEAPSCTSWVVCQVRMILVLLCSLLSSCLPLSRRGFWGPWDCDRPKGTQTVNKSKVHIHGAAVRRYFSFTLLF